MLAYSLLLSCNFELFKSDNLGTILKGPFYGVHFYTVNSRVVLIHVIRSKVEDIKRMDRDDVWIWKFGLIQKMRTRYGRSTQLLLNHVIKLNRLFFTNFFKCYYVQFGLSSLIYCVSSNNIFNGLVGVVQFPFW